MCLCIVSVCLPNDVSNFDRNTKDGFAEFTNKLASRRQMKCGTVNHNSVLGSFLILENADKAIGLSETLFYLTTLNLKTIG
jgi:hypothetical protein